MLGRKETVVNRKWIVEQSGDAINGSLELLDSAGFWVGIDLSLPTRADYDARLMP